MSNLWSHQPAKTVDYIGSFAIERSKPVFTPWPADDGAPGGDNDDSLGSVERDPAAIEAEAFAEGFEQGRRTAELELAAERAAIVRLAEGLEALRPEPSELLAAILAETVDRLVRQIAGAATVDRELLVARARAAAALLGKELQPSKLRVHPDDMALLETADLPVPLLADASLERGSLVLETASGWIEDGPAVRLDRLRAALDQMAAS